MHTGVKSNFLSRNYQEFDVNVNFGEKWDFENVNFVKNKTLKLLILWKMRLSKCEFCQKVGFLQCDFFWIKCVILSQCAMYVFLLAQVLLLLLNPARSLLIYSFCFFCKQLKFWRTSERISQLLPYCSWQIIDLFS